jgi:hypothetical protein
MSKRSENENGIFFEILRKKSISRITKNASEAKLLRIKNKKPVHNTVYKKLLVLAGTKLVACLPASDFPSENPRPQTRNFPYTNTLPLI